MPGESASDTQMSPKDKHRVEYFYIFYDMSNELQQHYTGLKEINEMFGFLKCEKLI